MSTIKRNKSKKTIKEEKSTNTRYVLYPTINFNQNGIAIGYENKNRVLMEVFKVEFITDTTKGEYTSIVKFENGNNVTLPTNQIYLYKKDADKECECINKINTELLGKTVYELQDKIKKISEILNPNKF